LDSLGWNPTSNSFGWLSRIPKALENSNSFGWLSPIPKALENSNSFGWLSRVNPFCPKGKMDGLL
jgi:hypothetical protein